MSNVAAFFARIRSVLSTDSIYLIVVYKVILAVVRFCVVWLFLMWLLHVVEKRITNSISESPMTPT
jgi:hypothetical protein